MFMLLISFHFYVLNRLTESGTENEADVDWLALCRSWPRPSIRSHQWLRAKWRRLKSLVKDHQNCKFKGNAPMVLNRFFMF